MHCPACGHERSASQLQCRSCGATFPREALERLDHLTFLLSELAEMARRRLIPESLRRELAGPYERERQALETALRPAPAGVAGPEIAAETVAPAVPPPPPRLTPAPAVPQGTTFVSRVAPADVSPRRPAAPPRLPRPRIQWENLWQALLSPRALEALLYVGAFLIVVAAGTFVYFNWGRFPPPLQLLFLAVGTASFFAGGWVVQTRWHLPRSGATLVGIGALIIPVDFYAWARFRDLPPDAYPAVWLAASAFCTVAYGLTTRWMRHRFFAVITLLAGHSLLLSLLHLLTVPFEWWAVPTILLAAGWIRLLPVARRLGAGLEGAIFGTAIAIAAVALLGSAVIHVDRWQALAASTGPGGRWVLAIAAAWWAAEVFFVAAAPTHPLPVMVYGAAAALPVAVILSLLAVVPRAWIALALLALAPLYMWFGERQAGVLKKPAHTVGMILPVVALVWAWMDTLAVTAAYAGGAALYLWWAVHLARPRLTYVAHGLAVTAVLAALFAFGAPAEFWPLGLLAPGLAGLALAAGLQRWRAVAMRLYVGTLVEVVAAVALLPSFRSIPVAVIVVSAALLVAVYLLIRLTRETDPPLIQVTHSVIPGGVLGIHWASAALAVAELVTVWIWWRPTLDGLSAAGIVLASLVIVTGRQLGRLDASYELPWRGTGIALTAAAPILAIVLQHRAELILTLLLGAASYVVWAWLFRQPAFGHAAGWGFLIPFALLLPDAQTRGLLPSREAYAWAFAGLGVLYLVVGSVLDRRSPRFAVPWHLVSQVLMPFALLWALQEKSVVWWTLAGAIVFYVLAAVLAHRGRSETFRRAAQWAARRIPSAADLFRSGFVYAAAALLPFWFYLTLSRIPLVGDVRAHAGLAMVALAWAYLGAGQALRRVDAAYVTPLRIGAQTLAAVGSLLAADRGTILIIAMSLGVGLQLGFVALTRSVTWVYSSALAGAGLLGVVLRQLDLPLVQAAWAILALGAVYLGLAEIPWRKTAPTMPAAAIALYGVAFLAIALGLLLASFQGPLQAALAYGLGAVLFLWAGLRLREALSGYAVAGLLAAAYTTALVGIGAQWVVPGIASGIWLLPGIAAFFAIGRTLERGRTAAPATWAGAFYIAAHIGTIVMMLQAAGDAAIFPWALSAGAVLYGLSAALFRSPRWIYPALITMHGALFFGLLRSPLDPRLVPAAFVPVTIAVALAGWWIERRGRGRETRWVRPWYVVALSGVILWELAGVIDVRAHVITSAGFALLAGAFVELKREAHLATLALVLLLIGCLEGLRWLRIPYASSFVILSAVALVLGMWEVIADSLGRAVLWRRSARLLAFAVSGVTLAAAVSGAVAAVHPDAGEAFVYTLAIVGLLFLMYGVRDRLLWLGYAAVAMLEVAWALVLLERLQVREPQWYAIPAALYLLGIGAIERRIGRKAFAQVIDAAGLTLLFGSALWQSVGPDGFPYAVLLAIETLLVAWFGAAQRLRRHFFAGLGVLIVNVIVQAIAPIRALDKTVLFLSLGIVLVVTAVLAERRREAIIRTTREWWARLEEWE